MYNAEKTLELFDSIAHQQRAFASVICRLSEKGYESDPVNFLEVYAALTDAMEMLLLDFEAGWNRTALAQINALTLIFIVETEKHGTSAYKTLLDMGRDGKEHGDEDGLEVCLNYFLKNISPSPPVRSYDDLLTFLKERAKQSKIGAVIHGKSTNPHALYAKNIGYP